MTGQVEFIIGLTFGSVLIVIVLLRLIQRRQAVILAELAALKAPPVRRDWTEQEIYDLRVRYARAITACETPVDITVGVGSTKTVGTMACGQCEGCKRYLKGASK